MNNLIKNKISIYSLILFLLVNFISCEKNPTDKIDDEAPPLPPAESMQANVTFFNNPPNQFLAKSSSLKSNFFAAAGRVFIINSVVLVASIVPTAIFIAAVSQTPELQSDGKFHWIYSVHQGENTYSADLAGSIDILNSEVIWEMFVTCTSYEPPLDNFYGMKEGQKLGIKKAGGCSTMINILIP